MPKMQTSVKLLIFDLDGTLVDSAIDYQYSLNLILEQESKGQVSLQDIHNGLGRGLSKLLAKFFPDVSIDSDYFKALYLRFQEVYLESCTKNSQLYPNVLDFLKSWNGKLALVTNKNSKPTHKIMQHFGLMDFEWSLISGFDTFEYRKPHPFPLQEALRVTNCTPNEALMIGDGLPDLMAAKAANIKSIAVTFGYNSREFLESHRPHLIIDCFTKLSSEIAAL
jgi:phosphoglycolate phosphatase